MLYPQNGDRIVAVDFVTSFHETNIRFYVSRHVCALLGHTETSVQPRPSAVNMTLPAFAAAPLLLSAAAVDRYIFPHGVQQQNRRTPLLLLIDGTDGHRETDVRRFTALAVSTSLCSASYVS